MIQIPLTKGYTAIIDDEDADLLAPYTWHAVVSKGKVYAATWIRQNGKQVSVKMHSLIMGANKGKKIDHIHGNTLDNRKSELRKCTSQQNSFNQKLRINSTTGYKGVSKYFNKFRSQIFIEGKKKYLGLYDTPKEAAIAYNIAATKYFGEFAKLNIIKD